MASSIALRRLSASPAAKLFNPFRSVSVFPSLARSFNTNAQMTTYRDEERSLDANRPSDRSRFPGFAEVLDPFCPTRSLSQILNLMDPFVAASRGGSRRGWDVKEDKEALYLRMDMPGVGKEDVKVGVENNTLIIKAESSSEEESEERRKFSSRIDLPEKMYQLDSIRAEMKNGVLKVAVPKVKEEDRKDVREVKVD